MLFLRLITSFNDKKIPYVLVGGYALALHGIVRATIDIDFVISLTEKDLSKAEQILKNLGLQSRIPVGPKEIAQFHEEYLAQRNLMAWSFVNFKDPTQQVDLLIHPPIASLTSQLISVHGVKVRVATKFCLLQMKKISNRTQDQADIEALEEALIDEKS